MNSIAPCDISKFKPPPIPVGQSRRGLSWISTDSSFGSGAIKSHWSSTDLEPLSEGTASKCPWEAVLLDTSSNEFTGVMTRQEIEDQITRYERMFGMDSDEFQRRMRDGTVPDTFEAMDWKILLQHRN